MHPREPQQCPDRPCGRVVYDADELLGHLLTDHGYSFDQSRFGTLSVFPVETGGSDE